MNKKLITAAVFAAVAAGPVYVSAQPGPQGPGKGPGQIEGKKGIQAGKMVRETIYGSQLMTLEERQEHQKKMWAAKTAAERQAIRDANHKLMVERAKQRGVTIDESKSDTFWMDQGGRN